MANTLPGPQPPSTGVSQSVGPGGVQVLEGWLIADKNVFSRASDMLQSTLVHCSDSCIPDGDRESEDGLSNSGVELHHHLLWQVEFL